MKYCLLCGERCDDGALELHTAQHYKHANDPESYRPLPSLSCSDAFARAFQRKPTDDEMDRILAGEGEAVYESVSRTMN